MSNPQLPERASLEFLKKLAKDRLHSLRQTDPNAKLAAAQLAVARDYSFRSWRALKAEIEHRQIANADFFQACAKGDVDLLRSLLIGDPLLTGVTGPPADASASDYRPTSGKHGGWTGLHSAAQRGNLAAVRLLLEYGADPNAREEGDTTYPLHWAAANRHAGVARALLDAGGDVHGFGDHHELDAIGWATFFHEPGHAPSDNPEVARLLIDRGARHHIFSAMCLGDLHLIRTLVEQDPKALDRRISRFEQSLTPLHFAIGRNRYDILDLLIELGAGLESKDRNGHSALETAMLRGDLQATARLLAAGAKEPVRARSSHLRSNMSRLADSVSKIIPMIYVPDVAAALSWYASIGFKESARYAGEGLVNFGIVAFGQAEIMLNLNGTRGEHGVSLWLYTDKVDGLYELLKSRQIEAALAGVAGKREGIEFVEHLNDTFYGARQFGIRDLNGYILYFIQQLEK